MSSTSDVIVSATGEVLVTTRLNVNVPPGSGSADQFGFVLAKGSALTACVSSAVDALRVDHAVLGGPVVVDVADADRGATLGSLPQERQCRGWGLTTLA